MSLWTSVHAGYESCNLKTKIYRICGMKSKHVVNILINNIKNIPNEGI